MEFTAITIILHGLTAVSASLLNTMILLTVFKTPSLQTPSRFLLCSLAFSDLLMGGVVQTVAIVHFVANIVKFRQLLCITWLFNTRLGYSLGLISLLSLAAISIDRCLAIVIKISYRFVVTKKRTVLLVLCIWVLASLVISTTVHFLHPKHFETVLAVFVAIFLVIITVSYSIAFYSLKRLSVQVTNSLSSGQQPSSDFNVFKYKRSLVTMVIVLAITLLLYLPFLLVTSIDGTFYTDHYSKVKMNVVFEFVVTISCITNPVVYLWRMKDLRRAMKNLLGSS